MNMTSVKLIDKSCKTYTYTFGNRPYGFKQGATEPVSVALALRLKKIKNRKGIPIFKIINLPEVIVGRSSNESLKDISQCLLFA